MSNKMEKFQKLVDRASHLLNVIAGVGLIAMATLAVSDIIGNKAFKFPLPGGIEVVGFLGVVVTAFSIAQTQILRGHIEVEFIVDRLPKKAKGIIYIFVYFCLLILWAVIAWRSYDFGRILQTTGEVSMTERIPFYPFVYAIAFCCILTFLVLVLQLIKEISGVVKK
jgi:TRAP-type C4-dicarboxylate transport system permease small subunit